MIVKLSAERARRRIFMVATLSILVMWVAATVYVGVRREAVLDEGRQRMATLAQLMGRHVEALLEIADVMLGHGQEVFSDIDDPDVAAGAPSLADASRRLAEIAKLSPAVRNLSLARADGLRIAAARETAGSRTSVGGQAHFEVHRQDPGVGLHVGGVVSSWNDQQPLVFASRRLVDSTGAFAGVVWISIEARAMGRRFAEGLGGAEMLAAVYDRAGTVLVRSVDGDRLTGRSVAGTAYFEAMRSEASERVRHIATPLDGVDRLVGWSRVGRSGLVVAVGQSTDSILAGWRLHAAAISGLLLVSTALLVLLCVLLGKALWRIHSEQLDLQRMKSEAETANRAKSEFLATMSHEVRTPLNGILGYANLLLGKEKDPDARAHLGVIKECSAGLRSLVDDFLDLARIEAGRVHLDPSAFEVAGLVQSCLSVVDLAAKEAGTRIEHRVGFDVPAIIVADHARVRQALLNLVSNAVKFTAGGMVRVDVACIDCNDREATLRFDVVDDGVGIAPAKLARLFQPFSQLQQGGDKRGVGLGLSIVKGLAKAMGGEVGVESTPGRGSRFWFTIRAGVATLRAPIASSAERRIGIDDIRVLVADDLAMNRELMRLVLAPLCASVETVADGAEALARVAAGGIDVVLMDVQMPVVDGIAATRRIRALQGHTRDVPVIALSASTMTEDIDRCRAAGMNDHVAKPVDADQLVAAIRRLVAPQAAAEAAPASATGPGAPASLPILDDALLAQLDASIGPARVGILMEEFASEIGSAARELSGFVASRDHDSLALRAHAVRSAALNAGANRLAEVLRRIEVAARGAATDLPRIMAAIGELAVAVDATLDGLRKRYPRAA